MPAWVAEAMAEQVETQMQAQVEQLMIHPPLRFSSEQPVEVRTQGLPEEPVVVLCALIYRVA